MSQKAAFGEIKLALPFCTLVGIDLVFFLWQIGLGGPVDTVFHAQFKVLAVPTLSLLN